MAAIWRPLTTSLFVESDNFDKFIKLPSTAGFPAISDVVRPLADEVFEVDSREVTCAPAVLVEALIEIVENRFLHRLKWFK